MQIKQNKKIRIGLLGASFSTGNMGVNALAECSIKCILNEWPSAEILLLASGRAEGEHRLKLEGRELRLKKIPIRFCKNVFMPNHFLVLLSCVILLRLLPWRRFKDFVRKHNSYTNAIMEIDLVADIAGGDSFSDIYGLRRFSLGFMCRSLFILFGKEFIMLPQTYGPFQRSITRLAARYILKHASLICSRDLVGVEYVRSILNKGKVNEKVRFIPDVAFILNSHKPKHLDIGGLSSGQENGTVVVGLNVSGLLFSGGYTQNNMFGLKSNYRELIYAVIEILLKDKKVVVLLIPHVFPPKELEVESDPEACLKVYESASEKYNRRVFLASGEYNHNEIKYIIGLCGFFIGSRMHSCIAALSQCIPSVGVAYSNKFHTVFETIGMERFVVDMRHNTQEEILSVISNAYEERKNTAEHLKNVIPDVQKQVSNLFKEVLIQPIRAQQQIVS